MLRGTHKGIGQSKGQQARHAHAAAAGRSVSGICNGICSRHRHRRRIHIHIRIRILIRIRIRIQLRVAVGATVRQSKAENFHIAVMKTQNARI